MTEIEHLLTKTLTKMEQELTTTQSRQTAELQHHKKELHALKEQVTLLQNQQHIQSKHLQNLSTAYENLRFLLDRLKNILPKG